MSRIVHLNAKSFNDAEAFEKVIGDKNTIRSLFCFRCRFPGVESLAGLFSNCSNLYFATLGSGLKHIGVGAFYNCSNMQTINRDESNFFIILCSL